MNKKIAFLATTLLLLSASNIFAMKRRGGGSFYKMALENALKNSLLKPTLRRSPEMDFSKVEQDNSTSENKKPAMDSKDVPKSTLKKSPEMNFSDMDTSDEEPEDPVSEKQTSGFSGGGMTIRRLSSLEDLAKRLGSGRFPASLKSKRFNF